LDYLEQQAFLDRAFPVSLVFLVKLDLLDPLVSMDYLVNLDFKVHRAYRAIMGPLVLLEQLEFKERDLLVHLAQVD